MLLSSSIIDRYHYQPKKKCSMNILYNREYILHNSTFKWDPNKSDYHHHQIRMYMNTDYLNDDMNLKCFTEDSY
ncbi:hypothetical protein DERF_013068 [Dermatophagoides farinae]|uniref:Uncharacterized protein n=1 Tax=Dermatophagoides farinae TaxID=6954 RepID=A0A922L028_DERFA|nr:hypothetical protein DERF_013068 [Dermatophagoides farinae]